MLAGWVYDPGSSRDSRFKRSSSSSSSFEVRLVAWLVGTPRLGCLGLRPVTAPVIRTSCRSVSRSCKLATQVVRVSFVICHTVFTDTLIAENILLPSSSQMRRVLLPIPWNLVRSLVCEIILKLCLLDPKGEGSDALLRTPRPCHHY